MAAPNPDDVGRGQWQLVPNWGIRNVFHGGAIRIQPEGFSEYEAAALIERIRTLLNRGAQ